jgi:ATP/maltotriose-dependent transcriptional regulator MalT
VLHRARLTSQLHANIGNGLAVLQAPAGYGKTTLLVDFASEVSFDYAVAWLTLDGSCTAPESLAHQLASALLGDKAWVPASATRIEDLKSYLDSVCGDAVAATDLPLLLIIENTHELRDADDSSELLGWLLEILPGGAEVVLSGRESARLVEVDRRVAAGECLILDATALAFAEDEIAALSAAREGRTLPAEILSATGGWPIAVMAILAGIVSVDGATRTRGTDAWERYLLEEVWRSVPERYQGTLLALSIPPVIDRELAIDLVGEASWHAVAPWLLASTLLGEPLGNGFNLNPQVRRFLRTEFETRAPERFAAAVARTVESLERRGQIADAVELARTAGCTAVLADVLARHSRAGLPGRPPFGAGRAARTPRRRLPHPRASRQGQRRPGRRRGRARPSGRKRHGKVPRFVGQGSLPAAAWPHSRTRRSL